MSSWERVRFLPWSRIPEDGKDLSNQKERIFRELQREAQHEEPSDTGQSLGNDGTALANRPTSIRFSYMELFRQTAFGGCIGSITGSVFGFMDGMRTAGESTVLKNASNMAKARYLMQGTTRSATVFGVFFGGFHSLKYGIRVAAEPGDVVEIAGAGAVSLGALISKPSYRASLPYASMLIIMDGVHTFMRDFNK
jgi:hypothetical protein